MPLLVFIVITHNSITLINTWHALFFLETALFYAVWFKQGTGILCSLPKVRG